VLIEPREACHQRFVARIRYSTMYPRPLMQDVKISTHSWLDVACADACD
jgi:hypothetical protein